MKPGSNTKAGEGVQGTEPSLDREGNRSVIRMKEEGRMEGGRMGRRGQES